MANRKRGENGGTYFQYLVADVKAAVLMGRALRIQAANEHRHAVSVLMSRKGDAQSPPVLLEDDHQHFMPEVMILLLYLHCKD